MEQQITDRNQKPKGFCLMINEITNKIEEMNGIKSNNILEEEQKEYKRAKRDITPMFLLIEKMVVMILYFSVVCIYDKNKDVVNTNPDDTFLTYMISAQLFVVLPITIVFFLLYVPFYEYRNTKKEYELNNYGKRRAKFKFKDLLKIKVQLVKMVVYIFLLTMFEMTVVALLYVSLI